eukprot:COSAG02_NODE_7219_length_3112_cov_17.585463_1_plen_258_part_00
MTAVTRCAVAGYPYSPYSNLPPLDYKTTCADIRAHCEGNVCGCALAGISRRPSGTTRDPRAECEDTHSGPGQDGLSCCEWKDSNAVGGTANGCTCQDLWMATESDCPPSTMSIGASRGPHEGCGMQAPCDGDTGTVPGMSWCLIDKSRSDPDCTPAGHNWDYCMPNGNRRVGTLTLGGLESSVCGDLRDEQDCRSTALCAWDQEGSNCYDQGSCVERPGMWSYGLEEHDDSGAVRASMGGASSVLALVVCFVAANWS